jgi:hypothetical protein
MVPQMEVGDVGDSESLLGHLDLILVKGHCGTTKDALRYVADTVRDYSGQVPDADNT